MAITFLAYIASSHDVDCHGQTNIGTTYLWTDGIIDLFLSRSLVAFYFLLLLSCQGISGFIKFIALAYIDH